MNIIADLHIHGRHSQATSKDISIKTLEKYARIKGVNLLGTGDFTHPKWIVELKKNLTEEENGIFKTATGFPFVLQTELSLIYTQDGRGRRIHNVVLAPDFDVVGQITEYLLKHGRVDYDGRPIFKIPCPEFVESLRQISDKIEVIPAHCLPPDMLIHTKKGMVEINSLKKGNEVLTHKGRFKKVKKIYKREYKGKVIKISPMCIKLSSKITTEHPVLAIKSYKDCKNMPHTICKPSCSYLKRGCKKKMYAGYKAEWIMAKDLEKGDIILFPRIKKTKAVKEIELSKIIKGYYCDKGLIKPKKGKVFLKNTGIRNKIKITKEFCRLIGYYLAEGYTCRDYVGFTFNIKEKSYIEDVKELLNKVFGNEIKIYETKEKSEGLTVKVYSKILCEFFKEFYSAKPYKSYNKIIPNWLMHLPEECAAELLLGWWRGDGGYTASKNLANQFKLAFLRMGVIPNIIKISANDVNRRREKVPCKIGSRVIIAKNDCYQIHHVSFLDKKSILINMPEFNKFNSKFARRKGWIDDDYVYLPIKKIESEEYKGLVYNLEVEGDNSYTTESLAVHNCWTPWFSLFGSMSGFDTVRECFGDQTKHIHALETGLSSDPAMNWRLSQLDKYALVSFSDLHSYWPWRMGREATIFDIKLSYDNLLKALRTKEGLAETIEVDPNYGKYHFDGHRNCNISLAPTETRKYKGICPVCSKPLTIGVLSRVEELADRAEGFMPKDAVPFKSLIPLSEIISKVLGKGIMTKTVWKEFDVLIKAYGSEMNILLDAEFNKLAELTDEKIARAIVDIREGKINIKAGYDGEYGVPIFSEEQEVKKGIEVKPRQLQTDLSDF